jgi:hypothetical protein
MEKLDYKNLKKQLEILGKDSIGFITKILVENDKVASGELLRSLDFEVIQDVNGLMLKLTAAPYFKNVDKGRRPGKMPPVKPIKSWIRSKGLVFNNATADQAAFMIARSIGINGIKPLNIKDKLIKEIIQNKEKLLKYGAEKDIKDLIDRFIISEKK